ncbi:MAG: PorP/SprF family type IX secretion system membrane protein [Bacteroidia bacterium]|nr:PorP/SprF family type IX secretion system membrane protein [Bacteroidia bacterium]
MKSISRFIIYPVYALFLFFPTRMEAQDFHLSQFFESPVTLNPATTGMNGNSYMVHLHQRTQWMSVASKPFLTEILSADIPYDRFGFGAFILNNTAGAGNLNEFHFLASGAFQITEENDQHHLCTGIQLGFIHKSINTSKLLFDSQYSYQTGTFDPALSNNENFQKNKEILFDANFGVYYYTKDKMELFLPARTSSGLIPIYAGFSAFHLTQPKDKFIYKDIVHYRKWIGYAGAMYPIKKEIAVEGNLLYMRQAKSNEIQMGLIGYYKIKQGGNDYIFMAGPLFRVKDALALYFGGMYQGIKLSLSYDINVSGLRQASHGRGGFEISISYSKEAKTITSFFRSTFF